MNHKSRFQPAPQKWLLWLSLLGLLIVAGAPAPGAVAGAGQQPPSLVAIEFQDAAALASLDYDDIQPLGRLYSTQPERLLALVAPTARDTLAAKGLGLQMLDSDSRGAIYYLASAMPGADWQAADRRVKLLARYGPQAIVKASDALQVESLPELGFELQHLTPLPLETLMRAAPAAPDQPAAITPDPLVQRMLSSVHSSAVYNYDAGLSGAQPITVGGLPYTLYTRYSRSTTPIEKATQVAYETFQSFGLPTSYHDYNLPGSGSRRNVIADQTGATQPNRIFLLTAHIDSTSNDPYNLAPGADDNGSGSTGVLLAAEVLSQYDFACTLRYALFTGEEQGLYGSTAYAETVAGQGANIEAVLNLDMIGYNSDDQPIIDLYTRANNSGDLYIANTLADVVAAYNLDLTPNIIQNGMGSSDHVPFWSNGYSAILAIEDLDDFTPYYHTTSDTLSTLDLAYFTDYIRAAVGAMAHMGCLMEGELQGTVQDATSGDPLAGAIVQATRNGNQTFTMATSASGAYALTLPPGEYQIKVTAAGYDPYLLSGVIIQDGQTTTLNIPMTGCTAVTGATFNYSPAQPEAGNTTVFTGTVDSSSTQPVVYTWQFGDRKGGSGQVFPHVYRTAGDYTVVMQASNHCSSQTVSQTVTVSGAPQLAFDPPVFDLQAEVGQPITPSLTLTNSGTAALTWSLDLQPPVEWLQPPQTSGEVAPYSSQAIPLPVQPPSPGVYTTTLVLTTNTETGPQLLPLTLNVPCTAISGLAFSTQPEALRAGEMITFTAQTNAGTPPLAFAWNFSGQQTVYGETMTHTFDASGAYSLTLTASNCAGSQPLTEVLQVAEACTVLESASFSYTPAAPRSGQPVMFSATASAGSTPLIYTWIFGDGSQPLSGSDLDQVQHIFPDSTQPLSYPVVLQVSNACSSPSYQTTITVQPWRLFLPFTGTGG